jgi:hypothetical protein
MLCRSQSSLLKSCDGDMCFLIESLVSGQRTYGPGTLMDKMIP